MHLVGVHPGVHHERPVAVAVHTARPSVSVRHDLVVPARACCTDLCVALLKHHGGHGAGSAGVRPNAQGLWHGGGWFVRLQRADCPGLSRSVHVCSGSWGYKSAGLFPRSIRVNSCFGSSLPQGRTSATRQMAINCISGDRRGEARARHHDGLRRPGRPKPASTTWCSSCGPDDGQLRVAADRDSGSSSTSSASGCVSPARAGDPVAGQAAGAELSRRRRSGRPAIDVRFEPGDIVRGHSFKCVTPIAIGSSAPT
jgi:hypothetical protein